MGWDGMGWGGMGGRMGAWVGWDDRGGRAAAQMLGIRKPRPMEVMVGGLHPLLLKAKGKQYVKQYVTDTYSNQCTEC